MRKINKNIDLIIRKNNWSNADGENLEKIIKTPSLTDKYYNSFAKNYSHQGMGNINWTSDNKAIIDAIVSESKKIASKINISKLNFEQLSELQKTIESKKNESNRLFNSTFLQLRDKWDDVWTSEGLAGDLALRNVRDVEGSYPNINHKYGNLIKNYLDHYISNVSNDAINHYLNYLVGKSKLVEDEIEYAKEKNTLLAWKKLEGKGVLESQKKVISDNIKALTPKEPATATKVNTTATANELVNGTQPTSMKKWIIVGAGGLLVIGVLFFVFRKSSN